HQPVRRRRGHRARRLHPAGQAPRGADGHAGLRPAARPARLRLPEEQRGGAVTTTLQPPEASPHPAPAGDGPRSASARGGRAAIVGLLIVSLVLAGVPRDWSRAMRHSEQDLASGLTATSSLANMNSFSLALLLGGLRGPLVMFLWTNS